MPPSRCFRPGQLTFGCGQALTLGVEGHVCLTLLDLEPSPRCFVAKPVDCQIASRLAYRSEELGPFKAVGRREQLCPCAVRAVDPLEVCHCGLRDVVLPYPNHHASIVARERLAVLDSRWRRGRGSRASPGSCCSKTLASPPECDAPTRTRGRERGWAFARRAVRVIDLITVGFLSARFALDANQFMEPDLKAYGEVPRGAMVAMVGVILVTLG